MGDKKHWCDPGAYGALRVQRSSIYPTIAQGAPTEGAARLGQALLLLAMGISWGHLLPRSTQQLETC